MSLQKIKNIIDRISDDDLEEFITDRWIEISQLIEYFKSLTCY